MDTNKLLLGVMLGLLLLAGCSNMEEQPKYGQPYDRSAVFGQAAREPLAEAVPVGQLRDDAHLYQGVVDGQPAADLPMELNQELLVSGQRSYNDFCSPCHGMAGYGNGVIAREGFPPPASFHIDTLRAQPVGYIFQVITEGKGMMFSYASRLSVEDRWAVAAFVRALQLSQHADVETLPAELQAEVQASAG